MSNPYQILGVPRSASADDIKAAYRKKLKAFHPDLAEDKQAAHEQTQELIAAYEILSDAGKRAAYDAQLRKRETEMVVKTAPIPPRYRSTAPIGLDFSTRGWLMRAIIIFLILHLCAAVLLAIGQSGL
ncbi:MAG: DnaJ domain-containing protein [Anaerolineae bacterium]|nr:DnaJ domain-containing protein [Anaerolineae bacterium]